MSTAELLDSPAEAGAATTREALAYVSLGAPDPFRLDRLGKHLPACSPLRAPTDMTARAVAWTLGLERVLITRLASGQHALLPVAQTGFSAEELRQSAAGIPPSDWLTRALEILELIGTGLTNREIAAARGLSTFTVRDHISNLLRKLQVGSRSAALVKAQELRLLRNAGGPQ